MASETNQELYLNSSIDDEMLDKIKIIYAEMRKNTSSQHHQSTFSKGSQPMNIQRNTAVRGRGAGGT